jgi:hypothetical protein
MEFQGEVKIKPARNSKVAVVLVRILAESETGYWSNQHTVRVTKGV